MERTKEDFVKNIEDNLRFIITISIFFLTLLPEGKFQGCFFIAAYIINYIIFEIRINKFGIRNLKWIKTSLFVGIGSYIIPLSVVAFSTQNEFFSSIGTYIFIMATAFISMLAIVSIPAITLVMVSFLSEKTWPEIKKFS